MNRKAQHLSLDAVLCLIMVAAIASFPAETHELGIEIELLLLQQENDLMKVWLLEEEISIEGMELDSCKMFQGRKTLVSLGEETRLLEGHGKNMVASETFALGKNGELTRIEIIVYY